MARQGTRGAPSDRRHDGTVDPRHPPSAVVNRRARSLALIVFLGGVAALSTLIWVGAILHRIIYPDPSISYIDTIAREPAGPATEERPGGHDPAHRPRSTADELEHRGVGASIAGPMPPLVAVPPITTLGAIADASPAALVGRRLEIEDVEVETHEGEVLWVRDDRTRMAIVIPESLPAIDAGTRVDLGGLVEETVHGAVRLRATRVDVIDPARAG